MSIAACIQGAARPQEWRLRRRHAARRGDAGYDRLEDLGRRFRADAADGVRDEGAARALRLRQAQACGLGRRIELLRRARIVDNANGIVDQPRLPRFKGYTNFDNYVPLTTWTKIAIKNTEVNDQGAFDAANNRFVAPVAGTYLPATCPPSGCAGWRAVRPWSGVGDRP
jgi:hypothetical protein